MLCEVVANLAVCAYQFADSRGSGLSLLMDGCRGDKRFHIPVIRVDEEANHRLRVIGLILDVGEHDDAELWCFGFRLTGANAPARVIRRSRVGRRRKWWSCLARFGSLAALHAGCEIGEELGAPASDMLRAGVDAFGGCGIRVVDPPVGVKG